jgi:proteic killer suppression protein
VRALPTTNPVVIALPRTAGVPLNSNHVRHRGQPLLRTTQRAIIHTMITSFRHKGLRKYFESGSLAGIQPAHANRLKMQLAALDTAQTIEDMDIPGFRLHPLKGSERGRWSIWVNGNWRVTFEFENGNAFILDYEDYH